MSERGYLLGESEVERVRDVVRRVEASPEDQPFRMRARPPRDQQAPFQWVKVTDTVDEDGYYAAQWSSYDQAEDTWTDNADCWLRPGPNDETPSVGRRYLGWCAGVHADDGLPVYVPAPSPGISVEEADGSPIVQGASRLIFDQADGFTVTDLGSGAVEVQLSVPVNLTVAEVDGSPSYSSVSTIRFDQADGFALSQPGAGIVRVDYTPGGTSATVTLVSSVSCSGTTLTVGRKDLTFTNGLLTNVSAEY